MKKITSGAQARKDLQKLKTDRKFLSILILMFVLVFFWITISLLTSQSKEEISKELTTLSKPLTPSIDRETLSKIQEKYSYSKEELSSFTIYKILTTRDGKTERIVPLEITVEDIDPKPTPTPTAKPEGYNSLLQEEINNNPDQEEVQNTPNPEI